MKYETLLEVTAAMHLTSYVDTPFPWRGGLFLVAPPGSLGTTITEVANSFRGVVCVSDINVPSLVKMKGDMQSNQIRTLVFTDWQKLYKRNQMVAANLEGIIMALVDEGFRRASYEPQSISTSQARCTVIGKMTTTFFDSQVDRWKDNGFYRRFMFVRYGMDGIDILENAVLNGRFANLHSGFTIKVPVAGQKIPSNLTKEQRHFIDHITRTTFYRTGNIVTLERLFAVLIWKFGTTKAQQIMNDFAPCLGKDGGVLRLEEVKK